MAGRRIRKIWALSARERRVLAEASALLPLVHALQAALPFRRWRKLLARDGAPATALEPAHRDRPSVSEVVWAVETARRIVPGTYECLPTAYAAHVLLHRHGYASDVHVGVARDPRGKVEAHAWVDCDARTVVGLVPDMQRFVPLPPIGRGRR